MGTDPRTKCANATNPRGDCINEAMQTAIAVTSGDATLYVYLCPDCKATLYGGD